MKDIFLLIEENKETQEGFIRGQTTDENKGLEWAKDNAKKDGSFVTTKTGFASKSKAFDVVWKEDLK
jgi:hypothetical protein